MALQVPSLLPLPMVRITQTMLNQSLIHDTGSPVNTNLYVAIGQWRRGQDSNLLSQLIG